MVAQLFQFSVLCSVVCPAGREAENERRTRFLSLTSDPEWHQTMVYPAVTPAELHKRQLELTVWHHQHDGSLEFLGEFLLDLTSIIRYNTSILNYYGII